MTQGKSSWDTTSGLIDEYEMTIEECWFGKPPNYREGKQTVLVIRGEAELDGELLDDEKENYYSLGDGWDPDNGGESAAHGSGKTQFNENSSMGKLIRATVGLGDEVVEELKSRGETYEAATWQGLRFLFQRKEFTFKDRKTGEENTYAVELPVEFLGVDEEVAEKPKAKAPAKKKAASTRRKAKAEVETDDDPEAEVEDETPAPKKGRRKKAEGGLRAKVVAFAAEWDDDSHSDFMEAVLDPDEFDDAGAVQADEELLNDILDEDGSIWTESRE